MRAFTVLYYGVRMILHCQCLCIKFRLLRHLVIAPATATIDSHADVLLARHAIKIA